MATVTKSIGTTARDYSTITLWEAALGGAAGGAGNDAVGECYDDSDFTESVTVDDSTPDSVVLSVASGERHDGTAKAVGGSGARNLGAYSINLNNGALTTIEWMDLDGNGGSVFELLIVNSSQHSFLHVAKNLIVHDKTINHTSKGIKSQSTADILNNIVYDIASAHTSNDLHAIWANSGLDSRAQRVCNNTLYNTTGNGAGSGVCYGIHTQDIANHICSNNISMQTTGGSGTVQDYTLGAGAPTNSTAQTNMDEDGTAPGSDPQASKTVGDQFVSTTGGSEDLHLKSGSDAIDNGTDLTTSPTGVNIDINGRDRDVEGDTWDIGAHELVAAPGGGVSIPIARSYYSELV